MELSDLSEFNFDLPEEQIAKFPVSKRDQSRLLVVGRKQSFLQEEPEFTRILKYLRSGDVLVANSTKVSKRRVFVAADTGRKHEVLFLSEIEPKIWKTLIRNSKKLKEGDQVRDETSGNFTFIVRGKIEEFVLLEVDPNFQEISFEKIGKIPIPPYFKRESSSEDEIRYQTVYSKNVGSVAAPTAGLHFTSELISQMQSLGIEFFDLELKVGYGTFQPLTQEHFLKKKLHEEYFKLPPSSASGLNRAKKENRRIISVGTTTLRALESTYDPGTETFQEGEGKTSLFLQPGDTIQSCEGLLTNFHLPQSSLLLLVSAFSNRENIKYAYEYAVRQGFRFFSYGDSMLILDPMGI